MTQKLYNLLKAELSLAKEELDRALNMVESRKERIATISEAFASIPNDLMQTLDPDEANFECTGCGVTFKRKNMWLSGDRCYCDPCWTKANP